MVNNILAQTNKPELVQYLNAELLIPTAESLLESIKQGLLNTWRGPTENLIKKHLENQGKKMGHIHTIRQGLQPTREKPQDIDLEDKSKKM